MVGGIFEGGVLAKKQGGGVTDAPHTWSIYSEAAMQQCIHTTYVCTTYERPVSRYDSPLAIIKMQAPVLNGLGVASLKTGKPRASQ